jgi:tRNA A-37 threonylcarbamoyl transferase component Bud32
MELLKTRKDLITDLKEYLPELVDKFNHFILFPIKSKKNTVVGLTFNRATERLPKEVIVKIFKTDNADNEFKTLTRLKNQNLSIPDVLFYKQPYLILEKIKGINLCDFINEKLINIEDLESLDSETKDEISESIEKLAKWFNQLHTITTIEKKNHSETIVLNKGDTQIRDFIYNPLEKELYGLDFEDSYEGNHIDDIAWVCCSLLDTNPGILEQTVPKAKIELINLFLKSYYSNNPSIHFDFKYFTEKLIENLNIIMNRRGIHVILNKKDFIKKISKDM